MCRVGSLLFLDIILRYADRMLVSIYSYLFIEVVY